MKIAFFATPEIAVPGLQSLIDDPEIKIVAVFTQPDRPVGRKQILTPSPIKALAAQNNLPIFQPHNKKELEKMTENLDIDFFVVIAYGMIFSQTVLEKPQIACINVHMSKLPQYRGASPIQQSILNGDQTTAISIMKMEKSLDSGPVYQMPEVKIEPSDNLETLNQKLATKTAEILPQTLRQITHGELKPQPQDHSQASHCKKITKEDGRILPKHSAEQILNMIRAFTPWPEVFTIHQGKKLTILAADISQEKLPAGQFKVIEKQLHLGTTTKSLIIDQLKPEGKKAMNARDFLNGLSSFLAP